MASIPRSRRIRPSSTRDIERESRRRDKGVARYYRLYELLSAALQDGTIAAQSALPSEPELCARHGISRTTVRRALARLEREGRIVRRRGSGTYALPQRVRPRLCFELHALPEMLAASESRTTTTTLRFDAASVPQTLRAIAAEIGTTAYVLERLLSNQGEPLSLTAIYLPASIGRRVQHPNRSEPSLIRILARFGHLTPPSGATWERSLRMPMPRTPYKCRWARLFSEYARFSPAMAASCGRCWQTLCRSDRLQLKVLERRRS